MMFHLNQIDRRMFHSNQIDNDVPPLIAKLSMLTLPKLEKKEEKSQGQFYFLFV